MLRRVVYKLISPFAGNHAAFFWSYQVKNLMVTLTTLALLGATQLKAERPNEVMAAAILEQLRADKGLVAQTYQALENSLLAQGYRSMVLLGKETPLLTVKEHASTETESRGRMAFSLAFHRASPLTPPPPSKIKCSDEVTIKVDATYSQNKSTQRISFETVSTFFEVSLTGQELKCRTTFGDSSSAGQR